MRAGFSYLATILILNPISTYGQTTDDFINGVIGVVPRVFVEWSIENTIEIEEKSYTNQVEEVFYRTLLDSGIEVISVYDFVGDIREANVLDCNITVMRNENSDQITEEYYTELRQMVVKWSDFSNWAQSSLESPGNLVPFFNSTATWSSSGTYLSGIEGFGTEGAHGIGTSCAETFIEEWNRINN
jgi:hypothetical protein